MHLNTPSRNRHISDDYLEVAEDWVTLDATARLLEESKSSVFSQRCLATGEKSVARAELVVKASPQWLDYIDKMVKARTAANKARIKVEYNKMRLQEWQSDAANERLAVRAA